MARVTIILEDDEDDPDLIHMRVELDPPMGPGTRPLPIHAIAQGVLERIRPDGLQTQ